MFKSKYPSANIEANLHSYIIDKDTNPEGERYKAYNKRRWGGDSWTYSLYDESYAKEGCKFKKWDWWPNTMNGHQLVNYSKQVGKELKAMEVLFRRIYEEGINISSKAVVLQAAEEIGLHQDEIDSWVGSKEGIAEVLRMDKEGKDRGIHMVPCFIIQGQYISLQGEDLPHKYVQALEKAYNNTK